MLPDPAPFRHGVRLRTGGSPEIARGPRRLGSVRRSWRHGVPDLGGFLEIRILSPIYERQFRELAPLRRHICSLLPLGAIRSIVEPGCGSGLLGAELRRLTDAVYTGMDIDPEILPREPGFVPGDAVKSPPPADLYVTSFFFSSVADPVRWLRKVHLSLPPGGMFAVFGEYDYESIGESPDRGLAGSVRAALEREGLVTTHGGRLDGFFDRAGFRKSAGGEIRGGFCEPDREFLALHVPVLPDPLPRMSWRIVWGIWRKGLRRGATPLRSPRSSDPVRR